MKKVSILVLSLFLIQFTTLSNSKTSDKPSREKAYFLTIYANNGTCTISRNIIVQVNDCSFRVSPNPAQSTLSLSFDSPEQLESIPDNIDLFDESKKNVKSLDMKLKKAEGIKDSKISKSLGKIDLDVRDLPRGIYYLHLTFGANREKQIEQIRIILN